MSRLAWWLDDAIRIPGTNYRIGWDGVIGLIPGVGDLIGAACSSYIINKAAGMGLPASALLRMAMNVAVELLVGVVPVLGDTFDLMWKSNQRNMSIIERYLQDPRAATRKNRLVLSAVTAGIVSVLVMLFALALLLARWVWRALTNA